MRSTSAHRHARGFLILVAIAAATGARGAETGAPITFEDHVAVILRRNCVQCHGEGKQEAGLNFTSYASLLKGGSGGKVVEAGRSITASPSGRGGGPPSPASTGAGWKPSVRMATALEPAFSRRPVSIHCLICAIASGGNGSASGGMRAAGSASVITP